MKCHPTDWTKLRNGIFEFTFAGLYGDDLTVIRAELDGMDSGEKLLQMVLDDPRFRGRLSDNIQQVVVAEEVEAGEIRSLQLQKIDRQYFKWWQNEMKSMVCI